MLRRHVSAIYEWLWRARALGDERARWGADSNAKAQLTGRARHAIEAADRLLDPGEPLSRGDGSQPALSLYREAAYWALAALAGEPPLSAGGALAELWARADGEALARAAGGGEGLAFVRRSLVEQSFVEAAAQPAEKRQRSARQARAFVDALVGVVDEGRRRVEALYWQRARRTGAALALTALVAYGALGLGVRLWRGPNLAAGKPWRTSSTYAICVPSKHVCNGVNTDIFFHTEEEESPWFELDLGAPTAFSNMVITNRSDCCADRAMPLVVEASDDRVTWRVVARPAKPFAKWRPSFKPESARYVRLRVERRSFLHLDGVELYR